MQNPTTQRPEIKILWSHLEGNINLRLLDIDYGYLTHGVVALVLKLEITNIDNDDHACYYFQDYQRADFVQYFKQYVNEKIRARFDAENKTLFKKIVTRLGYTQSKELKEFDNLELLIAASKIFGENYN